MDGKIEKFTVDVIGKSFEFNYVSPQHEACCRKAAEKVNAIAQEYKKMYFAQDERDILRVIAFQAAKEMYMTQSDSGKLDEAMQDIAEDLHAYIEKEVDSR